MVQSKCLTKWFSGRFIYAVSEEALKSIKIITTTYLIWLIIVYIKSLMMHVLLFHIALLAGFTSHAHYSFSWTSLDIILNKWIRAKWNAIIIYLAKLYAYKCLWWDYDPSIVQLKLILLLSLNKYMHSIRF